MLAVLLFVVQLFGVENFVVNKISITGNKITKPHIILQELSFKEGDSLPASQIDSLMEFNRTRVYNLALFSVAKMSYEKLDEGKINVAIEVRERWYYWPFPIFYFYTFPNETSTFSDMFKNWEKERLVYGGGLAVSNFRGRNEGLSATGEFGFVQSFGLEYSTPRSLWNRTLGITFSAEYENVHDILAFTLNGFGYRATLFNDSIKITYEAQLSFLKRWNLFHSSSLELFYNYALVSDSVFYIPITDSTYYSNAGYHSSGNNLEEYASVYFNHVINHRDWYDYPLKGYYLKLQAGKIGLALNRNPQLFKWYAEATKYVHLRGRFYAAGTVRGGGIAGNSISFPLRYFWGAKEYLRGYEGIYTSNGYSAYYADGRAYGISKAEFRYELLKRRNIDLKKKWIPRWIREFPMAMYLTAFGDGGYLYDDNYTGTINPLKNQFVFGYGVGYNLLLGYGNVLRVEYSGNNRGDFGIFLHAGKSM